MSRGQLSLPEPVVARTARPKRIARSRRSPIAAGSMEPATLARPIIKSAGGKTRLLPILRAHLPHSFERYLEPFCGGAALFFDLARPGSILGDLNADLVETYTALAFDVETVIRNLDGHAARHAQDEKRHYYFMRDLWNDPGCEMGTCERAATFLYLNRVCFNGLWRVNKAGAFNVPLGRYKNPTICDPMRLRAAAALFATAKISAGDFAAIAAMAARGDLAYLDPPYDGGTFVAYTSAGGGVDLQERIHREATALAHRGVHVMISNADTPLVRELFSCSSSACWHLHEISAPRSIAASGGKRGAARELLITSYPTPGEGN